MAQPCFLGRYQAIRLLGEGGQGRVYLARALNAERGTGSGSDAQCGNQSTAPAERLVVVKVLREQLAADPHYREAFRRESEFMARFRHPSAVELYEASMGDPQGACVVMEYVDGLPLDDLLHRHGRLPCERVGRLLGKLCAVLEAAHAQGIIHRDLKPANIMVVAADTPDERIKVLDFGLARLALGRSAGVYIPLEKFTGASDQVVVGTAEYICPEQFSGEEVGPRGDIYSVGVILYEMLTGRRPFAGNTTDDILAAHLYQTPLPFAQNGIGIRIAPAIEQVVQACLAKDPVDRPASARDLAERFEIALGQKIWDETEAVASMAAAPCLSAPAIQEEKDDASAVVFHLEAWMPERIAAIKLRGFLKDIGGEVSESVPGLIRVRLHRIREVVPPAPAPGLWARLGFAKKPEPVREIDWIDMDVYMKTPDPDKPSRLLITIRLRPAEGVPWENAGDWNTWCERIQVDLSAYLMAKRQVSAPPAGIAAG